MKASLIAVSKLTKNIPAEKYAHADDISRNPVYITFFRDYQNVLHLLKRKRDCDFKRKLSSAVLSLWGDFEKRLYAGFINDQIAELTKILMEQKEYNIAMNQCIDRLLLRHFKPVINFELGRFEDIVNLFSNFNLQDPFCFYLIEALLNRHVCKYEMLLMEDWMLSRLCSLEILLAILKSLAYILQMLFVNEMYQCIVFNVSAHIYIICRHVLTLGYSHRVIDQLKCCVDWTGLRVPRSYPMNNISTQSIPHHAIVTVTEPGKCVEVVDVDEMNWRMQLVVALCQCYYDTQDAACAETWARKMVLELTKVKERICAVDQLFTSQTSLMRSLLQRQHGTVTNTTNKLNEGGSSGSCGGKNSGGGGCCKSNCSGGCSCRGKCGGIRGGGEDGGGCPSGSFLINTELHGDVDLGRQKQQLLLSLKSHSLKFSMLIFKRAVVQSRRRPEGFVQSTNRFHANQLTQIPWPRSQTERLLAMLFEGGSAQFLAILACLTDICRKSCLKIVKLDSEETEVLDVYEELFFAAQEIISGGGGDKNKGVVGGIQGVGSMLKGMVEGKRRMFCMALQGLNGVCVGEVVEFVKLAYSYNQRSVLNVLLNKLIDALEKLKDFAYVGYLLELKVMKLVDRLTEMRGIREDVASDSVLYPGIENELLELVQCVAELVEQNGDHSMIIDSLILCWKKVRCFLQPPTDLPSLITPYNCNGEKRDSMVTQVLSLIDRNPNLYKWVEVMLVMRRVLVGQLEEGFMGTHCPQILLQLTTFLGLLFEGMSKYFPELGICAGVKHNFKCPNVVAVDFLTKAKISFEDGLESIEKLHNLLSCNLCHYATSLKDYMEMEDADTCGQNPVAEECKDLMGLRRLMEEVQVVLSTLFLRVLAKLSHFQAPALADCKETNLKNHKAIESEERKAKSSNEPASALLCGSRNRMLQALNLAVHAVVVQSCCPAHNAHGMFQNSFQLLHKMAIEEATFIHQHNIRPHPLQCPPCQPPTLLPPILLHKTNHFLIFKPPIFFHPCLSYFKLFGCLASPAKRNTAGYLDTDLTGSGVMASATPETFFCVKDLLPGQRYVFAIAGYDASGQMIGDKVGPSTHAILTSNPASFRVASLIIQKLQESLNIG